MDYRHFSTCGKIGTIFAACKRSLVVLNRDVKFPRNLGPAPDRPRHRTTLDGPSVKPSIHLRAQHQARQYINLALGPHAEPSTSPEPHVRSHKSLTGPGFGSGARPVCSNLTSLVLNLKNITSRRITSL